MSRDQSPGTPRSLLNGRRVNSRTLFMTATKPPPALCRWGTENQLLTTCNLLHLPATLTLRRLIGIANATHHSPCLTVRCDRPDSLQNPPRSKSLPTPNRNRTTPVSWSFCQDLTTRQLRRVLSNSRASFVVTAELERRCALVFLRSPFRVVA